MLAHFKQRITRDIAQFGIGGRLCLLLAALIAQYSGNLHLWLHGIKHILQFIDTNLLAKLDKLYLLVFSQTLFHHCLFYKTSDTGQSQLPVFLLQGIILCLGCFQFI